MNHEELTNAITARKLDLVKQTRTQIAKLQQDAPVLAILHVAALEVELISREETLYSIVSQGDFSFKSAQHMLELCSQRGLPLENWITSDFAEYKNRDFKYKLPSQAYFVFGIWLGAKSNCTLVVKERHHHSYENITYEMHCEGDSQ